MVLVQGNEELQEHVIYYLSRNLIDAKLHYTHVKKLSLATVHAVQPLRHYILLRQTLVVDHINPFHFVLSRSMIGGNTINGLWFCKNSNSILFQQSRRNHWYSRSSYNIFLVWMKLRFMKTLLWMSIFFSFWLWTHGMGILSSIFKLWRFLLTSHGMSVDGYII